MPAEVLDVTKKFMREPIRILVKKEELTLEGIRQFYIQVEREVIICKWILSPSWLDWLCWKFFMLIAHFVFKWQFTDLY